MLLDLQYLASGAAPAEAAALGYSEDPRVFLRPNRNHAIARALLLDDDEILLLLFGELL